MDNSITEKKLEYQPISDAIRRALIRYCSSYTAIFGEYIPLFINNGVLNPAFTAKQLKAAFDKAAINTNMVSIYRYLNDPHDPVVGSIKEHPFLSKTTVFGTENGADAYYIRPRYEMLDMLETIAYYRECELSYRRTLPPLSLYKEILDGDDIKIVEQVYAKINRKYYPIERKWARKLRHFMDFTDEKRTPIDNTIVIKPSRLKLAFFEALITKGKWTGAQIEQLTGISEANITYILKLSSMKRNKRRVIVNAKSHWEALDMVQEPGYAVKLDDSTYLIQLASLIEEGVYEEAPIRHLINKRKQSPIVPRAATLPGFQNRFVLRILRRVAKEALKLEVPMDIVTVRDVLDYIEKHNG